MTSSRSRSQAPHRRRTPAAHAIGPRAVWLLIFNQRITGRDPFAVPTDPEASESLHFAVTRPTTASVAASAVAWVAWFVGRRAPYASRNAG